MANERKPGLAHRFPLHGSVVLSPRLSFSLFPSLIHTHILTHTLYQLLTLTAHTAIYTPPCHQSPLTVSTEPTNYTLYLFLLSGARLVLLLWFQM